MRRAACGVRRAACGVRRAACGVRRAACGVRRAACDAGCVRRVSELAGWELVEGAEGGREGGAWGRERQRSDLIGQLQVTRVHCQLRRLKHKCHFGPLVVLTAVPDHRAKAFFTFAARGKQRAGRGLRAERVAGFIIFECGLERVALKLMQRRGYGGEHDRTTADNSPAAGDGTDEESGSWRSRISHSAAEEEEGEGEEWEGEEGEGEAEGGQKSLKGDASSGVLELQSVWFNFAAPPASPKNKRLEYNR